MPLALTALLNAGNIRFYLKNMLTLKDLISGLAVWGGLVMAGHILICLLMVLPVTEYALTDRRLLIREGRTVKELFLEEVSDMKVSTRLSMLTTQLSEVHERLHSEINKMLQSDELKDDEKIELAKINFGHVPTVKVPQEGGRLTHTKGYLLFVEHSGGTEELWVNRPDKLSRLIADVMEGRR